MCFTASPWPRTERLKQPSRSPESESAPQQSTTAPGWKVAITFSTTGLKIDS